MILGCMFYIRKLNEKVSYANRSRVSILVAKLIGKGTDAGGVVDCVTSNRLQFDYHATSDYCFSYCAHFIPKTFGTLDPSFQDGACLIP